MPFPLKIFHPTEGYTLQCKNQSVASVHPASASRLSRQIHTSLSPGSRPKPLFCSKAQLSAHPFLVPHRALSSSQLLTSLCSTASSPSLCTHPYLLPLPFWSPPVPSSPSSPTVLRLAASGGRILRPSPRKSLTWVRRSRSQVSPKTGERQQSTAHLSPTASLCNPWKVAVPDCHAYSARDGKVPKIQKYVRGWLSFS